MSFFRRWSADPLPEDWLALIERHVRVWQYLDDDERDLLAAYTEDLLTTRRWEAAKGFEITDRIRTVIAAQAALLVIGIGIDQYDDVGAIIVHPTTMQFERTSAGPAHGTETRGRHHLLGQAQYNGPVVIAWDSASASARHPERGHDVVLHEFAHKIDMMDGTVDGTPPLVDQDLYERWVDVCTREFRLLEQGESGYVIDDYGATDAGEFFAVVTETFFTRSIDLREQKPDLYEVFRDFYRQDPAARAERQRR
ncbi:MAG: M90 family metallopeptidase [Aquihabitans sp.]